MTAIVGILNKRAAVMAADSAVTVTHGEKTKIYNTATKIFRLSLENPIGVMIFSSVEFMGTPWDVIFKLYRDRRGKKDFNTLKEYAQSFVDFLNAENYFSSTNSQREYFIDELSNYYYSMKDKVLQRYQNEMESFSEEEANNVNGEEMIHSLLEEELEIETQKHIEAGISPEFEDYTIDNLRSYSHENFDELMELCQEDNFGTDMREQWEHSFYAYVRSQNYYKGTGIIFVGYGSKDIYPSLLPIYISGAFDHRMRYYFDENNADAITNDNKASVNPFAQTDVMLTLMKGIAPNMEELVDNTHLNAIQTAKEKMLNAMKEAGASEELLKQMEEIDLTEIQKQQKENLDSFIRDEYVEGLFDAVDSFSIDEMTNMAESLISVTNLQRHITSSDESVGGPIDVAVITRSEGFIWVKHKEWFRQELNPHTRVYE